MTDNPKRFAIVSGATSEKQLAAYLPGNYKIEADGPAWAGKETDFLITGEDVAGWTLEAYVIPRLLSGSMGCKEQFLWMKDTGGPESGPSLDVWLDDKPQTAENVTEKRRQQEIEEGRVCPDCGAHPDEGYKVTSRYTPQYGGGYDTFYNCKRCGYQDVAT